MFEFLFSEKQREKIERNKLIKRIISSPSDFMIQAEITSKDCLTIKILRKESE